jgi:2-dehydro-3-deoxygluconokinase
MKERMPDLISFGECMVEMYGDEPLGTANTFHRSYGGDTLNTLVMASRLGTTTGYITRVGRDHFGPYLLDSWQNEGVDTSRAQTVEGFNGLYFIALLEKGQREFTYYRKGSAATTLRPEDVDAIYISGAKMLHLSGITQAISPSCRWATLRAAQLAHSSRVRVSYDPNLRLQLWSLDEARAAMEEVLPYVDILLPSAPQETEQLAGAGSPEDAIHYFWSRDVDTVAVKLGEWGCLVGTNGEIKALEAVAPLGVVDTTGAGDAFNGAFLHGLLQGMPPYDAARLGTVVSGLKVGAKGAIAGMPTKQEIRSHFPVE